MIKENLVNYFETAIKENFDKDALSDYNGGTFTYHEVAENIQKFHIIFEKTGINRGDKIALIGKNSANWGIVYLATITYGAVIVPILPDFLPKDVHYIVNHSESKILFAANNIWDKLRIDDMYDLQYVFGLEDLLPLHSRNNMLDEVVDSLDKLLEEKFPGGLTAEKFKVPETSNHELAEISYTSGTTGFSKGVMLLHNSLAANVKFARENMPLQAGDKIVSFLPLAHAYGLAFEFLFPFSLGCHITFLTKTPTPAIITKAFQEIRPRLILSVPLVIEKIYKKKILPVIRKAPLNFLLKIPLINLLLYKKVLKGVSEGFGGNFVEVVVGGAALSDEIEGFFRKIGFPITVGYGMTECGPLVAYAPASEAKQGSCGRAVDDLEVKIDSADPQHEVGEILMRGENVMAGYYKNQEATNQAIDKDGWLHSGDLGIIDEDGFIFIKGRSKNMLLGSSGQNIYPEEIESMINNRACVAESLVVQRDGKLIALIVPDEDVVKSLQLSEEGLEEKLEHYRKELNKHFPSYMSVSRMQLHKEPFAKTPKQSIKRFMYQ
ncbi:MAG: long-chain fatty acid--CoA ligase [Bacteroidetes bacterium]|nr:MAG: long-chain fatty acid--CoA ligase [Bacteroidota bacterium]